MQRSPALKLSTGLLGFSLVTACSPVEQLQNVATASGSMANSLTGAGERPSLSPADLRKLQTREFASSKAAAFSGTMAVLLDSGYRVLSADLDSGLITAAAPTTGRLTLDTAGVARNNQTPLASAYVEGKGEGAVQVRVAFSTGLSGTGRLGSSGERAVLDESVYEAFFAQLEEEIRHRPAPTMPDPSQEQERRLSTPGTGKASDESTLPDAGSGDSSPPGLQAPVTPDPQADGGAESQ